MKKIITIIFVIFCISILSAELITLKQAQEMSAQRNPDLLAQESDMLSAEKSMKGAYLNLGPAASVDYTKVYQNPGTSYTLGTLDETSSIGISASQPVFNGGKILLSAQISKDAYKMQKASYQAKLQEIRAETESKYYAVQSNVELVKALEKTLEQSRTNLETAKAKMDAGLLSNAEYLQMESEKLSSELNLINMQNALELSKLDLANYIGYTGDIEVTEFSLAAYETILKILQKMDIDDQNKLTAQLLEYSGMANPTLKISGIGVSTAKKSKLMAAGSFLPSINLSYSYDWTNSNLEDEFDGSSSLVLSASLPVFPIADNLMSYQAAHYDLKSSERTHTSTENSINLAVRSSCLSLYTSSKAVETARISNESAWETWRQMRERFEQGLISSADLLSTEVMVMSSDNNYISAKQDFLKAISSLVQITGMSDEKELLNKIENLEE